MAFPTTLTGFGDDVGFCTKPFISSAGNVYVFGRLSANTDTLAALKATDPTSSFSGVGTDIVILTGVAINSAFDAVQVGDAIHIVTGTGAPSNLYIHYHVFDMSSDSWTTSAEAIKSNYPLASSTGEIRALGIAVRSDGDVIVLYNGTYDTIASINYARVKYARKEGGSWTIDVAVDDGAAKHWWTGGAVLGSSDRTHFFFESFTNDDEYQRTLTNANVLETFPAAYDTACNSSGREQGKAVTYVSGGATKVRYAYSDSASDSISVAKFDSADAPTVTEDVDVTVALGVENNYFVSSLSVDGTTLWHAFIGALSDDIFTQSNADGAGWSGNTNRIAGTFNSVKTNIYTRGTDIVLAFVYAAAGAAALYNELDIGDAGNPTISGSAAFTLAALTAVSAGTAAISGSAAFTLGALTTSAAGTAAISGSAAFTLGALTTSAAGTAAISGSAAFTLAALTAVSAATAAISGSATLTLDALTTAAAGAVATSGSAAFTLAALTAVASGTVATSGSAAFTLGALTVESAGTSGDPAISGSAAFTLGALTTAAAGAVATSGDAAFTLGALTTESAGTNASPATATDSSAGSGGKSARRKFKLPEEAIEEAWSLERLYREDPVEAPVQEDITGAVVYTPLTLAVVTTAPHQMVMKPVAPVPKAYVLTRAVDEDDEEFDNVVRLIAALF